MKYKIGFIDEDHLQWEKVERNLRDFFDVIEYDIYKGISKDDLIEQVYNSDIDLLLVDYLMTDRGFLSFNGDEFARDYEKIKPRFPIIVFTTYTGDAFKDVDNPNIIYDKALLLENTQHLVDSITKNIELYKNYIYERKDKIAMLLQKRETEGLNAIEKNLLLEMQLELRILDKKRAEVPLQLIEDNTFEKLAETTKEAERFLESLIKKEKDDSIER